ncbi:MAG TPA: porin [Saprospiraceae bacterium]|nr:porin [Saprospiraceae bacterium]HMP24948.1 porin [Saprospiraceae bacterium]
MNKKHWTLAGLAVVLVVIAMPVGAQEAMPETDHAYKPLTLKLDEKGDKYVRFLIWHQFWATATHNNPGTLDINGEEVSRSYDIALRRSRMLAYAQVSPRFLILTHFGINNHSFINGGVPGGGATGNAGAFTGSVNPATNVASIDGTSAKKPQLFFHDIWTEFNVIPTKLDIGVGLHYWGGISRMTSASTLNFATLDAPIFNWPLIELTDQFARQFGVYAKGQLGKIDYRLALNKPFTVGMTPASVHTPHAVNVRNENFAVQGYAFYQFAEEENNKLPFLVGSYLGTKKIFNIGAGFHIHPEATASLNEANGSPTLHDMRLFGVDAYLDLPINKTKGTFFHAYSAWYSYDFGPGYLRNIGILNLHVNANPNNRTFNGGGNAQPTIGTGTIWYTQMGYGLPQLKKGDKFMPYVNTTYKNFDRLNDASLQFDFGLNYFMNAHHAKITLQYATRPIYDLDLNRKGSRGEWILQTHVFL